jgi:hypothetical protein
MAFQLCPFCEEEHAMRTNFRPVLGVAMVLVLGSAATAASATDRGVAATNAAAASALVLPQSGADPDFAAFANQKGSAFEALGSATPLLGEQARANPNEAAAVSAELDARVTSSAAAQQAMMAPPGTPANRNGFAAIKQSAAVPGAAEQLGGDPRADAVSSAPAAMVAPSK